MKLIRKNSQASGAGSVSVGTPGEAIGRRTFLSRSGLTLGGTAVASMLPATMMRRAHAKSDHSPMAGVKTDIRRSICTHCSVGCGVIAEVQNGVWTGQEPDYESPFNLGSHCAKGASVREHGMGERRLKYPTKLEGGKWKRISVQQRAVVSVPQAGRLLGHQQRRPPGAHLPLHHRGGRGEHLGLRRHDQLV
jgi:formate dehydrogenase major subunit